MDEALDASRMVKTGARAAQIRAAIDRNHGKGSPASSGPPPRPPPPAAALATLLRAVAAAHGEHGGGKPLGATGVVAILGYQVELLSEPGPLAAGERAHVIAKITEDSSDTPVSGGTVL